MTRCFIAIFLPDEIVSEVARMQDIISKRSFNGKLTELKNIHLTLKFLGEIDDEKVNLVRERLKGISFNKIEVKLGELGSFAKNGNPRIVWIKIEGRGLWDLQSNIDNILKDLGFEKEERFMSHVTLARIKYVKDKKEFREYIKSIKPKKLSFTVDSFELKKSELLPQGPTYGDIEKYSSRADL